MAAGAASFVGRLQDRRSSSRFTLARRGALIDDRVQRRHHIGDALGRLDAFSLRCGQPAVAVFLQIFDSILAALGNQRVEIHEHRCAVVLAGPNSQHAAHCLFDREAHHGFVDRAYLLDIERAIGEALARAIRATALGLQGHQAFEHAQNAAVGDSHNSRLVIVHRPPFEKRKDIWIKQLAAPRLNEVGRMATMDEPKQRQQAAPAAAPLVHRVRIERRVFGQFGVEPANGIAVVIERARAAVGARGQEIAILGIEHKNQAHQDREETFIEVVGPLGGELSCRVRIGCVEAAQQFMQRTEHLFGECSRYRSLRVAALL